LGRRLGDRRSRHAPTVEFSSATNGKPVKLTSGVNIAAQRGTDARLTGQEPTANPRVTELPQLLQNSADRRRAPFAPRSILLFLKD
jgi:hypothetical protein